MKEQETIAKITRDMFKKREIRFARMEILEKSKNKIITFLKSSEKSILPIVEFHDNCHTFTIKELYFHPTVISLLQIASLKIYILSQDCLKWEQWNYNDSEYQDKIEKGELMFYVPVKKQLEVFIDTYKRTNLHPLSKQINTISRKIDKTKFELSSIQNDELYKISIEEAFMNKKYVSIFIGLNMVFCSLTQSIQHVVHNKRFVTTTHINDCIATMKRFNEERMIKWLICGMARKYNRSYTLINTYKMLPKLFHLLMRMEKLVKTRIRRNTIYVRPVYISRFAKEINLFKKNHHDIWVLFYTSNIPNIFKNYNFSDILINHIYEYIYGVDKHFEYSYTRSVRLPQPGTLTA
jgi:hypothetical protein